MRTKTVGLHVAGNHTADNPLRFRLACRARDVCPQTSISLRDDHVYRARLPPKRSKVTEPAPSPLWSLIIRDHLRRPRRPWLVISDGDYITVGGPAEATE